MEQVGTIITTVTVVFGSVIALLIYIWNLTQKANEDKHAEHKESNKNNATLIAKLADSAVKQDLILQELRMLSQSHQDDIRTQGREIKELQKKL